MIERLAFVTTSNDKLPQVRKFLGNSIVHVELDIPEIQSYYLGDVVDHKAQTAFEIYKRPLLVDDTSLSISSLDGWPGPLVKLEIEKLGLEGILKMLDRGDDRRAFGQVMFGFHDGEKITTFSGIVQGTISKYPEGKNGFGWDSIFIPLGYTKTRAEMDGGEFDLTSPRVLALKKLKAYLLNQG